MPRRRVRAHPGARGIRADYQQFGAQGYYQQFGAAYRNPHEPIVYDLLAQAVAHWRLPLGRVLDLACGSGEATLALRPLGAGTIDAADPYTGAAYAARTGQAAEPLSFEQIAAGALAGRRYDTIVCSFALHLAPLSRLPALAIQLGLLADYLLIITPHKRPAIRAEWGWAPLGELLSARVRARCYAAALAPGEPHGMV
ncbi:MAG: class I SAM-dependent methyltransferase [Kouleothrix sp.]|jgi:SAM-dependent methyltransferase|nr:class I SAM-dependent methyltransferase [Kouleothrix sp.]